MTDDPAPDDDPAGLAAFARSAPAARSVEIRQVSGPGANPARP